MPAPVSPTERRRELGSRLRSLRSDAGLTAEQVAEWLGVDPSKISRLETGQRGAAETDIARLCDLYQVDAQDRSHLAALAADGKKRAWWQRPSLPYSNYIAPGKGTGGTTRRIVGVGKDFVEAPDKSAGLTRSENSSPEVDGLVGGGRALRTLKGDELSPPL